MECLHFWLNIFYFKQGFHDFLLIAKKTRSDSWFGLFDIADYVQEQQSWQNKNRHAIGQMHD